MSKAKDVTVEAFVGGNYGPKNVRFEAGVIELPVAVAKVLIAQGAAKAVKPLASDEQEAD